MNPKPSRCPESGVLALARGNAAVVEGQAGSLFSDRGYLILLGPTAARENGDLCEHDVAMPMTLFKTLCSPGLGVLVRLKLTVGLRLKGE